MILHGDTFDSATLFILLISSYLSLYSLIVFELSALGGAFMLASIFCFGLKLCLGACYDWMKRLWGGWLVKFMPWPNLQTVISVKDWCCFCSKSLHACL